MKKNFKDMLVIRMCIIFSSLFIGLTGCATQLPAVDPSLDNSETAILVIPKNIWIKMNAEYTLGTIGKLRQVRIPAGTHKFEASSQLKIMVPLGYTDMAGYNYREQKTWLGPYNLTFTFEAGKKYRLHSEMRWDGRTFKSQRANITIKTR